MDGQMDRYIQGVRAPAIREAAKRHSVFWREVFDLVDWCYISVMMTGSYQALDQRYMLKSGVLITGRDAMKLASGLPEALKDLSNIDAKDVWEDAEERSTDFMATA